MTELGNSTRSFLKATYSRISLATDGGGETEATAVDRLNFVRGLKASPAETKVLATRVGKRNQGLATAVRLIEATNDVSVSPLRALRHAGQVASTDLVTVGEQLVALRAEYREAALPALREVYKSQGEATRASETIDGLQAWTLANEGPAKQAVRRSVARPLRDLPVELAFTADVSSESVNEFVERRTLEPVAWLHLERIETTPVGIERGELVGTVPMAPGEQVTVSHKEWATTASEFEDIIVDELEDYSERGVAEKSDVAMSNESERKRDSSLNFGVSATGSYGPVSVTTTLDLQSSRSERNSRAESTRQSKEQTRKASSRVRKEHKVSVRVETRSGTENIAAKVINNPSDQAMRIDYYRMMRKWRVDLIRYGLRMTYDLVVPDPGATLRRIHGAIDELKNRLGPFEFPLQLSDISDRPGPGETEPSYRIFADRYGAPVPPPPKPTKRLLKDERAGVGEHWRFHTMDLEVDDGYMIDELTVRAHIGQIEEDKAYTFGIEGTGWEQPYGEPLHITVHSGEFPNNRFKGATGQQSITFFFHDALVAQVNVDVTLVRTPESYERWRAEVWNTLHTAAQTRYLAEQQDIAARLAELEDSITRDDTLTLRRVEREELMKRTLQWLFGPDFDVSPRFVHTALTGAAQDESELVIGDQDWMTAREFGEFVKFIHHAVEWENVLYFLYPYFWGHEPPRSTDRDGARPPERQPGAPDRRDVWHPDPARRDFIRAGAARVVLPIRPGFEREFACFMETGNFGTPCPSTSPYVSIAEEMQSFARTNYIGIPSANPDGETLTRRLISRNQQQAWDGIQQLVSAVEAYATAAKQEEFPGWQGAPAESRYYPTAAQGFSVLTQPADGPLPMTDPWGHEYRYDAPGKTAPFVIWSPGADGDAGGAGEDADISTDAEGNLIATWYEYTPSSGIDIEVAATRVNVS